MQLQPAASFLPLHAWLPLATLLLLAQAGSVRLVLRPPRALLWRAFVALLLADAMLVALLRFCVARLGGMDYSEQFLVWRQWFLAMGIALIGLPIPLWVVALRVAGAGRALPDSKLPIIHPLFATALVMWLATTLLTITLGADFTFWPRPARITRIDLPISQLPRELDGLRVAIVTDLHTGELVTPRTVSIRLQSLKSVKADFLVLLGDITYLDPTYQPEAARLLAEYVIPGRTFAVGGNLDSGAGTDTLRAELAKVDIIYLENATTRVAVKGVKLTIAGLGDLWTGNGDLTRTLSDTSASDVTVLLSHSPDILPEAVAKKVALVLSGHLHGGQIVIPFAGPAVGMSRFGTRFASGHWRIGETQLVVSRGLGEESLPLRLFCPPEIVIVTLRVARNRHANSSHTFPPSVEYLHCRKLTATEQAAVDAPPDRSRARLPRAGNLRQPVHLQPERDLKGVVRRRPPGERKATPARE